MQTVGLYDELKMKVIPEDEIRLSVNLSFLPTNENNLICKAIAMLKQEFGIQEGIEARLEKRIPVAAGMAGGSSDAAAALVGMNRLFRLGLSKKAVNGMWRSSGSRRSVLCYAWNCSFRRNRGDPDSASADAIMLYPACKAGDQRFDEVCVSELKGE